MDGKYVVARREHQCTLCRLPISVGEKYWYERLGPMDHSDNEGFFTYKAHQACDALWQRVGGDLDWYFTHDPYEWRQMLAEQEAPHD
jgi:hypothetical protein